MSKLSDYHKQRQRPEPIPELSEPEIKRTLMSIRPSTSSTITIRHEWTLELKEFDVHSAQAPAFLLIHWPMCGDYKLDLRTNRLSTAWAGKRGKTRGAQRWRVLDYPRALAMYNQLMKLTGPSQLSWEEPQ